MNLIAKKPLFVSSSSSVSPGKDVTEVKVHGDRLKEEIDRDDPIKAQNFVKPRDQHYHEQFMEKLLFNKLFKIG